MAAIGGLTTHGKEPSHRRRQVAIELGLPAVPCVVAPEFEAVLAVVSMLSENTNRVDLPRTEIAAAYQQLALLEWTAQDIADLRGCPVEHVHQALALPPVRTDPAGR